MVDPRAWCSEWLYNYLKTFYVDESRVRSVPTTRCSRTWVCPTCWQELQGVQRSACVQLPKTAENGGEMRDPLVPVQSRSQKSVCGQLVVDEGTGLMSAEEFDQAVYDIVNFLYYTGEPSRLERHRTGVYVILFLVILYVFTFLLGREFQKDVK